MNTIFGVLHAVGETVRRADLMHLAAATEQFASDGTFLRVSERIGMGRQPFFTTHRSRLESGPQLDQLGNMLAFDGRLDNHQELRRQLDIDDTDCCDSALVLAAFTRWGEACFARLVGDWALALWSATDQQLYLARDHAGTRTLYFGKVNGTLTWSTYLETFFMAGASYAVDEAYAASFLAGIPIRNLTPYQGIRAVPPAHFLKIANDKTAAIRHWNWMADDPIRYKADAEFEEHFLSLFKRSVERRTVPGAPILAQLSGGMDSTSIVCVSDYIRRSQGTSESDLLDTLSYYDDTEPDWNEKPYFSIVEAKRGKVGLHVETSFSARTFEPPDPSQGLNLFPGADSGSMSRAAAFHGLIQSKGYRVLLSGIGGDEVLGGVPTPTPELADYLVSGQLGRLMTQTTSWCLANREAFFYLLADTLRITFKLYLGRDTDLKRIPLWVTPSLRKICAHLQRHDLSRGRRLGFRPTSIINGLAWWAIMETLPHRAPSTLARYEYRYPYLDLDLVDFLFRVPREQLARPGRRRSLMRRALRGIVPVEILERRRKAAVSQGPLRLIQTSRHTIDKLFRKSIAVDFGFVDPLEFRRSLELTVAGRDSKSWSGLLRTVDFELWLRGLDARSTLATRNEFMLPPVEAGKLCVGQVVV